MDNLDPSDSCVSFRFGQTLEGTMLFHETFKNNLRNV